MFFEKKPKPNTENQQRRTNRNCPQEGKTNKSKKQKSVTMLDKAASLTLEEVQNDILKNAWHTADHQPRVTSTTMRSRKTPELKSEDKIPLGIQAKGAHEYSIKEIKLSCAFGQQYFMLAELG